jgi:uncharacterized membrane protein YgcG
MTSTGTFRHRVALVGATAILGLASAASAQTAAVADARWQAWLGCWAPVIADSAMAVATGLVAPRVCITPAEGKSAVKLSTISNGRVVDHTIIDADGQQRPSVREGCTGWERAEWSKQNQRLYLKSEHACEGGIARRSTAIIAMGGAEWLDVRRIATSGTTGLIRAVHYRALTDVKEIPAEVLATLRSDRAMSISAARIASQAPATIDDVIEAVKFVDAPVVEAWLAERGQGFGIDDKQLVKLADARVPGSVIDVMVALSYPQVFALDHLDFQAERRTPMAPATAARAGQSGVYDPYGRNIGWGDPFDYYYYGLGSPYGRTNPYASRYNDYYSGQRPIVVYVRQTDTGSGVTGNGYTTSPRVVNGKGYTEGRSSSSGSSGGSSTSTTSGGSSSGSSSSGSAGGSTGGAATTTTGTAKPRGGGGGI